MIVTYKLINCTIFSSQNIFVIVITDPTEPTEEGTRCWDMRLSDLSNKSTMGQNGWAFENKVAGLQTRYGPYQEECKESTFYEYGLGSVTAVFHGSRSATLGFGNCFLTGMVEVLLYDHNNVTNATKISVAQASEKSKHVTFDFQGGSMLSITTNKGIMALNSLDISCGGIFRSSFIYFSIIL